MNFKKYLLIYALISILSFIIDPLDYVSVWLTSIYLLGPLSCLSSTHLISIYIISTLIHLGLVYGFFKSKGKSKKISLLVLILIFWVLTGHFVFTATNAI